MVRPIEPPFWLVWSEDGDEPRKKHSTSTSAENEARRLANLHPGHSFVVLAPTMRATKRDVMIERFDPSLDEIPF